MMDQLRERLMLVVRLLDVTSARFLRRPTGARPPSRPAAWTTPARRPPGPGAGHDLGGGNQDDRRWLPALRRRRGVLRRRRPHERADRRCPPRRRSALAPAVRVAD